MLWSTSGCSAPRPDNLGLKNNLLLHLVQESKLRFEPGERPKTSNSSNSLYKLCRNCKRKAEPGDSVHG